MLVKVRLNNGLKRWWERVLVSDAPPNTTFGLWATERVREAVKEHNANLKGSELRWKFSRKSVTILDATKPCKPRRTCDEPTQKPKRKPVTPDDLAAVSHNLNEAIELGQFALAQLASVQYKRAKGELTARGSCKQVRHAKVCLRKVLKAVRAELMQCKACADE